MPPFAYIDPGAGSLVIQALLAAILSIPFFFRTALRSTLRRLRRPPGQPGADDEARTESD